MNEMDKCSYIGCLVAFGVKSQLAGWLNEDTGRVVLCWLIQYKELSVKEFAIGKIFQDWLWVTS